MKRRAGLSLLLIVLFGTVFLVSLAMTTGILIKLRQEKQSFAHLSDIVAQEKIPSAEGREEPHATVGEAAPSPYAALKEQNPDFFGWISIEGTKLDYPVMYTPEEAEYYLRRDYEGGYSLGGVPFLDAACYEGGGNYLIYGHNMKNGSMFAPLLSYSDSAYYEAHRLIRFDTLEETGEYEVIAAFYSQVYKQDDNGVFRYYQYTDLSDPEVFASFMDKVQAAALYDTGVTASYGGAAFDLIDLQLPYGEWQVRGRCPKNG